MVGTGIVAEAQGEHGLVYLDVVGSESIFWFF
jgi:hypothetical protein